MANNYTKGLNLNDLLNIDNDIFNKMGFGEMREVVSRLSYAANRRLTEFDKQGTSSPAYRHVKKSGGRFSAKGKDLNSLRAEYVRARNFLKSETGTVGKWNKVKRKTIDSLRQQGIKVTFSQFDDMWEAYEDLKELDPGVAIKSLKYLVLREIVDSMSDKSKSVDDIVQDLHSRLSKIYEEKAEADNDFEGVSSFFE